MLRRALLVLLGLVLVVVLAPGSVAAADPSMPTSSSTTDLPGMLLPHGRSAPLSAKVRAQLGQKYMVGDCQLLDNQAPGPRHCKPTNPPRTSCSGYTSQTTPPAKIRVLVRTGETTSRIDSVDFKTYVEDVLPNEWDASWDGDSVRSGLVAIKSYAWYWVTHYGGYYGSSATPDTCFDVTDDPDFQVYVKGSGSTDPAIVQRECHVASDRPPKRPRRANGVPGGLSDPNDPQQPDTVCGEGRNGTQLSQTGSEVCNKSNNYNNPYRYNVILRLYYGDDIDLNSTVQLRTQHDFLFQHRSTGGTFSAGKWYIADGYPTTFTYGQKGDLPFVATTGDGFATAAVWRPASGTFYVANALHQLVSTVRFGTVRDIPVAAHYRGLDTAAQLAVFRPASGVWYLAASGSTPASSVQFGTNGDVPVPGRWASASKDSIAVWRPSSGAWYQPGKPGVRFGQKGDVPVPADYTGDGITDIAVWRPSNQSFYRGSSRLQWGAAGDVPVTGDFDGDGKADFAVYRPSNHTLYVRGVSTTDIGAGTPIGAAPFRG